MSQLLKKGDVFYHPLYHSKNPNRSKKPVFTPWEVEFNLPEDAPHIPCISVNVNGELSGRTFHISELYTSEIQAYKAFLEKSKA